MKKPPENPFEQSLRNRDEYLREQVEVVAEEAKVRFMIRALGFTKKQEQALRTANSDAEGTAALTFRAFNEEYRSFPVLLGFSRLDGVKLHLDERAMFPALFKRFDKVPYVVAFDRFYEMMSEKADGRAVGLVFSRKGIQNGMIIHGDGLDGVNYHGTELVYHGVGSGKRGGHKLHVRPFQTVVETIYRRGHGWKP